MKRFQKFIGVAILLEMAASCPGCQSNRWPGYRTFKPTVAQGFVPSSVGDNSNKPVVQWDKPDSAIAGGTSQREPSSSPTHKNTNDSPASCSSGCCGGS